MLVRVPAVLGAEQLASVQQALASASWVDGRSSAGFQSAEVKSNLQVPASATAAVECGSLLLRSLERSALFVSAALPHHVFPPLFSRYESGMSFGAHIDNAVRQIPGTPHRMRTDLAATLFLAAPHEYDGGELRIQDTFGSHAVKLDAGDLVVYPASSVHRVEPVTRGVRTAAFFWIQSMVRDDGARALLFELDGAIRQLSAHAADHDSIVRLTGCYHNLLRRWAEL